MKYRVYATHPRAFLKLVPHKA